MFTSLEALVLVTKKITNENLSELASFVLVFAHCNKSTQRTHTVLLKRMTCGVVMALLAISAGRAFSQSDDEALAVEGFYGNVSIVPNVSRQETTVALTLPTAREGKTNQIVFHVQETTGISPAAWSGPANVLYGYGLLAIRPKSSDRNVLFRFVERAVPSSMSNMHFDEYFAYGIAKFGENKSLSDAQIQELSSTGRLTSYARPEVTTNQIKLIPDHQKGPQPMGECTENCPVPVTEPDTCVAGGPGSSSCSAGGCSVTCGAGYHSCCSGGTCLCFRG